MNLDVLKTELTDDPLGRGYSGMNDEAAAADLNAVCRKRDRTSLTGSEIINAVDVSEWTGLTDAERQTIWNVVHLGEVNPFGVEAGLLIGVFGGSSTTIGNLAAARKEDVSRATELGLSAVYEGTIQQARAL